MTEDKRELDEAIEQLRRLRERVVSGEASEATRAVAQAAAASVIASTRAVRAWE